jgi:hypothetical protein
MHGSKFPLALGVLLALAVVMWELVLFAPARNGAFWFARVLVCSRFGVPTACATAGYRLALYFIFIDPCAGRHLLLLLRQKK